MIQGLDIQGNDLQALENYCGHFENLIGTKPIQIIFDCFNNEVYVEFTHDDFVKVFGGNFDMKEVSPIGNSYTLERIFWTDKGTKLIIRTSINVCEVMNKQLVKYRR